MAVLGYPAEIYANGIQIFLMTLQSLFFVPVSTYMFISVFYKMKLTSVYEVRQHVIFVYSMMTNIQMIALFLQYLERRYDTVAVRWLASIAFILKVCNSITGNRNCIILIRNE